METVQQLLHNFLVLFAMVNAVGNLPIFADLTGNMNKHERNRTFLTAVAVGGGIVMAFALSQHLKQNLPDTVLTLFSNYYLQNKNY